MTRPTDVDVLIVGAGPTGLTMACLLAQFGIRFRIIDKNAGVTDKSKALVVQARTLELFEQFDLAAKAVNLGHPAEGLDLISRGKKRASIDLMAYGKGLTKYPFLLILEQCKTEKLLLEKVTSLCGAMEWKSELVNLEQHAVEVTAVIQGPAKIETIRAKYVIAADGARSAVRSFLRLPFEGGTYENHFFLGDVAVQGPLSRSQISLCISQKGFAGFFPMFGSDRFRAICVLSDQMRTQMNSDFASLAAEIQGQAQLPLRISDPRWLSAYKLHHRRVLHFKEHRCFFAGDAAHIHSPAGGQGMNTGIQDAFNLAWKLAFVLKSRAQEKLLDTYHEERYPVASRLLHTTDRAFAFATDRSLLLRFLRLYVTPPLLAQISRCRKFRAFAFRVISQIGIAYPHSSLSEQKFASKGVVKAGDRFYHHSCPAGFFHAVLVGGQESQQCTVELLESYFEDRLKVHTLDKRPETQSLLRCFGIQKDGLVLIRPDGYVAYCAEDLNLSSLRKYLSLFFIEKNTHKEMQPEPKEAFPFESFI